jgi:L-fuculose-phosphate aldolase
MRTVDLTGERIISKRDALKAIAAGGEELLVAEEAVLTITAQEALRRHGCALRRQVLLFGSAEAEAAADEVVAVGRKLWQRQYVDGNGGNVSCRVGEGLVVCTPTLVSKGDLRREDLCLVDLTGQQVAGSRACTSEILMHLEIYRTVPQARAVVHSHPPHASAYAITGRIPPDRVVPEYEVFIGRVALARYETPGTRAFAQSVLPHVRDHNTVLLANHGVVCWADSVTRAEWQTEILDTYCWLLLLAGQLRVPLTRIPRAKVAELAAVRRRMLGAGGVQEQTGAESGRRGRDGRAGRRVR